LNRAEKREQLTKKNRLQLKKPNKIEKTRFKTILYYLKEKNTTRKATRDSIIAGRN
jgi:hypothetical protein